MIVKLLSLFLFICCFYASTAQTIARSVLLNPNYNLSEQIKEPNTVYVLENHFRIDLSNNNDTETLPEGCTLEFRGGSISHGVLKGHLTNIRADRTRIFGNGLTVAGTWNVDEAYVEWFGANGNSEPIRQSCSQAIQRALESPFPVLSFGIGYFYVDTSLQLSKIKTIHLTGNESLPLEPKRAKNYRDRILFGTVIWTDQDINVLEVRIKGLGTSSYDTHTFHLDGGSIDVSRCRNYNHAVIALYKTEKCNSNVYPYLQTCLQGPFEHENTGNTGIGICFVEETTKGLGAFYGGIIQCYINGFHTAVKHDFTQTWITNIEYHCAIDNCRYAYDFGQAGNSGGLVDGWVQTIYMFDANNDETVIKGRLHNLTIAAKMWDVNSKANYFKERQWSSQWVAKIERATETPTITGRCADSYERFKNAGLALMKIPTFEPDAANYRSTRHLNYIRYVDNSLLGFSGIKVDTDNCKFQGDLIDGNGVFAKCSEQARAVITLDNFSNAIGYPRLLVLTFNDYHQVNFFQDCSMIAYRSDGTMMEKMEEHFDGSPKYIEHAVLTFAPRQPHEVAKVVIELSHPFNPEARNCIYRLEGRFTKNSRYRQTGRMIKSTAKDRPQMVTEGFQVYDQDARRPIYWNRSGRWNDANGYTPAPNRGSFAHKPDYLTNEDEGFLYYDTTGGRFIFWDGKCWKDLHSGTIIKQ